MPGPKQCSAGCIESTRDLRVNALSELLSLPDGEKTTRGLAHTPAEIAHQPDAWLSTFGLIRKKRAQIT
jgi:hypothetical protein